jgi:acetolactate synthase-1/2/3 large subunit
LAHQASIDQWRADKIDQWRADKIDQWRADKGIYTASRYEPSSGDVIKP